MDPLQAVLALTPPNAMFIPCEWFCLSNVEKGKDPEEEEECEEGEEEDKEEEEECDHTCHSFPMRRIYL